jgi:hypothetical protein
MREVRPWQRHYRAVTAADRRVRKAENAAAKTTAGGVMLSAPPARVTKRWCESRACTLSRLSQTSARDHPCPLSPARSSGGPEIFAETPSRSWAIPALRSSLTVAAASAAGRYFGLAKKMGPKKGPESGEGWNNFGINCICLLAPCLSTYLYFGCHLLSAFPLGGIAASG